MGIAYIPEMFLQTTMLQKLLLKKMSAQTFSSGSLECDSVNAQSSRHLCPLVVDTLEFMQKKLKKGKKTYLGPNL